MCEGYTANTKTLYGSADRKLKLKSGAVIRRKDIAGYFEDRSLMEDIETFHRWTLVGFPKADWGDCPNRMVQAVLTLKPYHDFYKGG